MILHTRSIPALTQLTLDWVRLVKSGATVACLKTSLACYSQTPFPPLATAHKGRYSGQKLVWKTNCIQRRNQKANVEYPEYHGDRERIAAVNKRIISESLQRMREHWCNKLMYTYSDCNICTSCCNENKVHRSMSQIGETLWLHSSATCSESVGISWGQSSTQNQAVLVLCVMYKSLRASKGNYVKRLCLVVPLVPRLTVMSLFGKGFKTKVRVSPPWGHLAFHPQAYRFLPSLYILP